MAEKRILIADADHQAWEKFRQALGPTWLVAGAANGAAAMTEAQKGTFDAIVANYELPDLNGAELLNRLRLANPKTLRFIAADEGLREKIVCHILGGHQFLALPFDPSTLKAFIERSLAEDYGMSQSMRELVGRIRTFPTIPSLYVEVVNALKDPNATTEDIGVIIGKDMAMTTKLVQVLNSAYYGLPRTITDPTEAVGILGFETVKSLIMTVKLLSQYDKVKPVYFSIDTIWRHSTNVAHTAKAMALMETGDAQCSGHAYTAGLMHDLGKVILAANFDEKYHEAHTVARRDQTPLWEVEKEILGASHGEIGAYLLGLWGMSNEIVRVAAFHHSPLRTGDKTFTALTAVHVANTFEYEGDANPDGLPAPVIDAAYLQQLGLEARLVKWRKARRNPEDTKFETKMQRAKAAAARSAVKTAGKPAGAATAMEGNPAAAPAAKAVAAPAASKVKPLLPKSQPAQGGVFPQWAGLGLAAAAAVALAAWWEMQPAKKPAAQPIISAAAKPPLTPAIHEVAAAPAPAPVKPVEASKPLPAPAVHAPAPPVTNLVAKAAPTPAAPAAKAPPKTGFDRLKLEAIFYGSHPSAIINGQLAEVNGLIADCRVLDIGPASVTVEYQNQRKTITIR
ncbi:MAG TPA: response regulator [Verrucomicrobiae bacterium]|jgi:HD-like signal output (HDOD) protein